MVTLNIDDLKAVIAEALGKGGKGGEGEKKEGKEAGIEAKLDEINQNLMAVLSGLGAPPPGAGATPPAGPGPSDLMAAVGGGQPPMDPAMAGGMPPPMDPSMMGGMPPPMPPPPGPGMQPQASHNARIYQMVRMLREAK